MAELPLWFHELTHFSLSTLAAFLVWRYGRLLVQKPIAFWKLWVPALLSGFFIDADHIFDHLLAYGVQGYLNHSIFSLFTISPCLDSGKIYVFGHAWEWLFLGIVVWFVFQGFLKRKSTIRLSVVSWSWCWQLVFLSLILSYAFHLSFDQLSWPTTPWGYFLTHRLLTGFSLAAF